MFVFKLHTFDKRCIRLKRLVFFCQRAKLNKKSLMAIAQFLLLLYSLSLTVAMLLKLATFVSTFPQWGKLLSKMEQSCFYYLCNFLHNKNCRNILWTLLHNNLKPPSEVIKPHSEYTTYLGKKVSVKECF
jgi:hypothetical protein